MHATESHSLALNHVSGLQHTADEIERLSTAILRGRGERADRLEAQLAAVAGLLRLQIRLADYWPSGRNRVLREILADACADAISSETDREMAQAGQALAHLLRTYAALERHELSGVGSQTTGTV